MEILRIREVVGDVDPVYFESSALHAAGRSRPPPLRSAHQGAAKRNEYVAIAKIHHAQSANTQCSCARTKASMMLHTMCYAEKVKKESKSFRGSRRRELKDARR